MDQPTSTQISSNGIRWNEVTWYSKLLSIIFLLGVLPALAFYFGVQYEQISQISVSPQIPIINRTGPVPPVSNSDTASSSPVFAFERCFSAEPNDIYRVGTLTQEPYSGSELWAWKASGCLPIPGSHSYYYRIAVKGKEMHILPAISYIPSDDPQVLSDTSDNDNFKKGLELLRSKGYTVSTDVQFTDSLYKIPDSVTDPKSGQILHLDIGGFEPYDALAEASSSVVFSDAKLGQIWLPNPSVRGGEARVHFYQDGIYDLYTSVPDFVAIQKDGLQLHYSLPARNLDSAGYVTDPTPCGSGYQYGSRAVLREYFDSHDLVSIKIAGINSTDPVFSLLPSNPYLHQAYQDFEGALSENNYAQNPTKQVSEDVFTHSNPIIFIQNKLGLYEIFYNSKFVVQLACQ